MSSPPPRDAAAAMGDGLEDQQAAVKRKRNLPGTPDPEAEVIALSPKTLMATNRFLCEVCGKGFQRDQNLQLHRRGHNLPWKLKQRDGQEVKRRVYVCPEASCIHHDPSRALGDLTGIKKHFSRKHGEKKWKCEKCSKRYAVHSDWKAHQKVCGTREYRCDCGTSFSRRDSFITHRAFCDALAQENAKASTHRPVEAQQSSDTGGNALMSLAREPPSVMEASPSSFRQQATSERPSSEILEPLGRDSWEANSAFSECGGLKGLQGGLVSMPSNPMIGPGLSLSLGTGLGPGPPCPAEFISSLSQTMVRPLSNQMNKLVDVHPDRDGKIPWSLPLASAGIFTSMLAAANGDSDLQGCGKEAHDRIGGAQLYLGVSPITETSAISQFANSTYSYNGSFSSKHQRQHTGSAQLPATTLLQKAAIMGVTKSNSFLFRNLGDSGSASPRESRQHNSWAGVTSSSLTSSWQSLNTAAEAVHSNCGPVHGAMRAGGFSSTSYGGQGRAQESSGASRLEDISHASSSSSSSMTGVFLLDGKKDCEMVEHSDPLHEGSNLQNQNSITCAELEGSQRGETNRMTLDFLGVGDHDSSQRDECNNSMLGARVNPERFFGGRDA